MLWPERGEGLGPIFWNVYHLLVLIRLLGLHRGAMLLRFLETLPPLRVLGLSGKGVRIDATNMHEAGRTSGTDGSTLADYHCFGQADKYNFATVNYAVTPQERTNIFVTGTYHLTDKIDAYMTAYHNKTAAASASDSA